MVSNLTNSIDFRDVAIIFHAHCLSPFRFYTDMNLHARNLWSKGIAFPLERLYNLIEHGVWSDASSEVAWIGAGKASTYQVWDSDPATGGKLVLQDVDFKCASCSHTSTIPLAQFTETHTTKTAALRCTSCGHQYNADSLSATYLREDLLEFLKSHNPWSVSNKELLMEGLLKEQFLVFTILPPRKLQKLISDSLLNSHYNQETEFKSCQLHVHIYSNTSQWLKIRLGRIFSFPLTELPLN
jgi:DNA-directed RNA polymerase subunit RPC12/RpoP